MLRPKPAFAVVDSLHQRPPKCRPGRDYLAIFAAAAAQWTSYTLKLDLRQQTAIKTTAADATAAALQRAAAAAAESYDDDGGGGSGCGGGGAQDADEAKCHCS